MPKSLNLIMEVVGCPTVCMHCWAQGKHYKNMPLTDIIWSVEEIARFCEHAHLSFEAYPMHEVLAHPDAPEILKPFAKFTTGFQPMATVGIPLARRDDWREVLSTVESLGTTTFWVHFHGVGGVHDKIMNQPGAYEETCLAVERIRSVGFECGCNVFLTTENIGQVKTLTEDLKRVGIGEMCWGVSEYYPTPRARHYESIRPTLDDLLPHADQLSEITCFIKDKWANLPAYTETAHVERALNGDGAIEQGWRFASEASESIELVCRNNLDVYTGTAQLYGKYHGNLRQDGGEKVLNRALEHGPQKRESLCFSAEAIPDVRELAGQFGNPNGQKIYFNAPSVRWRWLDLAFATS